MMKEKPYVVSKSYDQHGEAFWYVHKRGYAYVPVWGSLKPTKAETQKICNMYNRSCGYE